MLKNFCIPKLVVVLLMVTVPSWAAGNDRSTVSAAIFDKFCLNTTPEFAVLDRRATEAHYEVALDRNIPLPNGQVFKQKGWAIPVAGSDAVMLTANDSNNGSLHVYGCSIYGPDLDGAAMESALSALQRLGNAVKHAHGNSGSTLTTWVARVDNGSASVDSEAMLSWNVPGLPGASVFLTYKTQRTNWLEK